jgi:hypothetical protein
MLKFIVYSVVLLIVMHLLFYYFNFDYFNLFDRPEKKNNTETKSNIDKTVKELEDSLNQFKHNLETVSQ